MPLTFEKLLGTHPTCGRAWLGLSLIELGRLQVKAAKRDILLALKYMPDHIGTWHVRAWIEIMLGNVADAEAAFQQALAVDRNFGETHGGLAVVAAMRGEASSTSRSSRNSPTPKSGEATLRGFLQFSLRARNESAEEGGAHSDASHVSRRQFPVHFMHYDPTQSLPELVSLRRVGMSGTACRLRFR